MLTSLLLDKMKSTARETGVQGRIINVSSIAHKRSDGTCFELNKLNDKDRLAKCYPLIMFIDFGYMHERSISSRIIIFFFPTSNLQVPAVHCICTFKISQYSPRK